MAITESESVTARDVLKSPPLVSLLMERSFMSSGGVIRYRGRSTRPQRKQPHHNCSGTIRATIRRFWVVIPFLLLVAGQGMVFFTLSGPISMPDYPLHDGGAWSLATGQWQAPVNDVTDSDGNIKHVQRLSGPANLFCDSNGTRNELVTDLIYSLATNNGKDPGWGEQHSALDRHSAMCTFDGRANQYLPLLYVPQAIGMRLAMHDSQWTSWTLLQSSRAASLVCYALVGALAVFLIGAGKWTMTMVLASPVPVFCAAAGMVDANVIVYCALYVAIFLRLSRVGKQFGWKQTLLIALLTIPLPWLKTVYTTIALLYLTLPARIWTWNKKLAAIGIFALVAVPIQLWSAPRQLLWTFPGTNIAANREWMLSHPGRLLIMLLINVVFLLTVSIWRNWRQWMGWLLPILVITTAEIVPWKAVQSRLNESVAGKSMPRKALMSAEEASGKVAGDDIAGASCVAAARIDGSQYHLHHDADGKYASNIAIGTACVAAGLSLMFLFLSLALTWTPDLAQSSGIILLAGFQERYIWPLLPMLALATTKRHQSIIAKD